MDHTTMATLAMNRSCQGNAKVKRSSKNLHSRRFEVFAIIVRMMVL